MDAPPATPTTATRTKDPAAVLRGRAGGEKRWATKDVHRISLDDLSPDMRRALRQLIAAHRQATAPHAGTE